MKLPTRTEFWRHITDATLVASPVLGLIGCYRSASLSLLISLATFLLWKRAWQSNLP
jgi:hypothetical protein